MATLKPSDFSDELKNDLTAVHSLLNEETGNVLDVEQLNQQPPTALSSGIKFSSDPIFGTRTVVVQPGENIQQAIDLVNDRGGGTVVLMPGTHDLISNLTMFSEIALVGFGSDETSTNQTTLDCNSIYTGISCADIKNFKLEGFTLKDSIANSAININDCDNFEVNNVQVLDAGGNAFSIIGTNFVFNKCIATNPGASSTGFNFPNSVVTNENYILNNCRVTSSGAEGFAVTNSKNGSFINCIADSCNASGFYVQFQDTTNAAVFISCVSTNNNGNGFESGQSSSNHSFIGCRASGNQYGFYMVESDPIIVACDSTNNSVDDFFFNVSRSIVVGNRFKRGTMPEVWLTKPLAADLFEGEMVAVRSASFKGMVARINGMALYFNADASSTTTSSTTTSSTTTSSTTSSSTTSSSSTTTA